ncbi:AfsR/SARP family transcriptional regulator [Micromonospora luteifusca]|uniref:AfsR/SARP family transcriptional regulator n=1 Tax=Micromonospora luteifusca TaxID=709860 RepID=UPI0033B60E1B
MEFRLLGSVHLLSASGELVRLNRRMERLVLAVLLLEPGRVITTDRLIDLLWREAPPPAARTTLQTLVSRIRTALRSAGGDDQPVRLVAHGQGYLLQVQPDTVDLHRFRRLVDAARPINDPVLRSARLTAALELWRGPALADAADGDLREQLCGGLEESRFAALSDRIDADLDAGRHSELVPELSRLAHEHPTRERLSGQLMLALHRSGRRADALAAYRRTREILVAELGLEPGSELRRLAASIITDREGPEVDADEAFGNAAPAEDRTGSAASVEHPVRSVVPAQLPPALAGFVGRTAYLRNLGDLLVEQASGPAVPPAMPICVIAGTAGIGKTTLAVTWAHQVRHRFPDGQLHVNLRAFDPNGSSTSPGEALRGFLEALHIPTRQVPPSVEAQTGLYRSLLADKRVLILLDNARDAEQVRPLLPASPGCLVLVTSRNVLSGLVATEGAVPMRLDLPSAAEATELLARRVGADRIAAGSSAVEDIITRCARLPLALAIVAARAATKPSLTVEELAAELSQYAHDLDAFDGEEVITQLRTVFSWSYRTLSVGAAHLFRLLGLHPGPDVSVSAAAGLAGVDPHQVRPLLAELVRVHLIAEDPPGRYAFHDLLAAYAAELVHTHDSDADRRDARHRLLDHYLQSAYRAALLLEPRRDPIELATPLVEGTAEDFVDPDRAMQWFADERPVLLAAIPHAASTGFDRHAWQLAWTLSTFFNRQGRWPELITALDRILRLADRTGQAHIHRLLGLSHAHLGHDDSACTHLQHALDLTKAVGDRTGQANVHHNLTWLYAREKRDREALVHARQALNLYQATNHRAGQARMLNAVAWLHVRLGNHQEAVTHCRQALVMLEEIEDRPGKANSWDTLGYAFHHLGRYEQATIAFQRALDLFRLDGDRFHEADTLAHLGETQCVTGATEKARRTWQRALRIFHEIGHADAGQLQAKLARLDRDPTSPPEPRLSR